MDMYEDGSNSETVTEFPKEVGLGQKMYFGFRVESGSWYGCCGRRSGLWSSARVCSVPGAKGPESRAWRAADNSPR